MSQRPLLSTARVHPDALKAMETTHADIIREVDTAVQSTPVVVVGMKQNPVVGRVRKALVQNGIEFKYLEYGSYVSQWRRRLALKLWSGWPTFPQIYVKGQLIGGCADVEKKIADGTFKRLLE